MRVLCLHGAGTSGAIFRAQTASFRAKLDESYTFDFVDAPFPSGPGPGVEVIFKSRNYTWWHWPPEVGKIRSSHQWLVQYLNEHGPYDAVAGFSQGCSLLSSFLLYHARETPDEALPFKAAIFICGGVPFPVLEDLGLPISRRAHEINDETTRQLKEKAGNLSKLAANLSQIKPGMGLWDDTTGLMHDPAVVPDPKDVGGLDYTSFPQDVRITIPTLHIYGAKDPRWIGSVQLAYFCDDRTTYDHGGGHDIPRSTDVSTQIASLVEELGRRAY